MAGPLKARIVGKGPVGPVCPLCDQSDAVRKISSIVAEGTTTGTTFGAMPVYQSPWQQTMPNGTHVTHGGQTHYRPYVSFTTTETALAKRFAPPPAKPPPQPRPRHPPLLAWRPRSRLLPTLILGGCTLVVLAFPTYLYFS